MKKVLIIIPYENLYPPINGGMHRCFFLLLQLARKFDVTAIIHQQLDLFLKAKKEFPEIENIELFSAFNYPVKKDIFSFLPKKYQLALRYRWIKRTLKGPADSLFLKYYHLTKCLIKKNKYDVVILENISTLNITGLIRRYLKKAFIVYDSLNVDSKIAKSKLDRGLIEPKVMAGICKIESTLYKRVDGLFVCSDIDLESFIQLNKGNLHTEVIPNGVQLQNQLFNDEVLKENPGYIIFCGSLGYGPNSEGLMWFYTSIWPIVIGKLPKLKLIIVGSGVPAPGLEGLKIDKSVKFEGMVSDVKVHYNKAAVAVVPLLSGSGTRLKILEAMNLGVPVISTAIGAEGIDCTSHENIIIADDAETFAEEIIQLILQKNIRISIAGEARKLVTNKYDWNVIGEKIYDFVNKNI